MRPLTTYEVYGKVPPVYPLLNPESRRPPAFISLSASPVRFFATLVTGVRVASHQSTAIGRVSFILTVHSLDRAT